MVNWELSSSQGPRGMCLWHKLPLEGEYLEDKRLANNQYQELE